MTIDPATHDPTTGKRLHIEESRTKQAADFVMIVELFQVLVPLGVALFGLLGSGHVPAWVTAALLLSSMAAIGGMCTLWLIRRWRIEDHERGAR